MRIFKHASIILLMLIFYDAAYACTCVIPDPPCAYYGRVAAIFLGRAVGSPQPQTQVDEHGNKTVYDVGTIRFLVQENYKGAPGYEIEIHSGTGGGDCGFWFLRNESYVVYAYRNPEDNKLYTSICSRTKHVSRADEDLAYLRALAHAKPGATLYGSVNRFTGYSADGRLSEYAQMKGVKILVTGGGQTIETVTNEAGEYKVTGLPPGEYDAVPQLPDNLGAGSNRDRNDGQGRFERREPVRLLEHGCANLSFSVRFSGSVSGKVVDAVGQPVKKILLTLLSSDNNRRYWSAWTDDEGYYEFRMVQPGSYFVGFNLEEHGKGPETYYPGVKSRADASLITVGEGEKLKGYDLTIPTRLLERQLEVTVVWPDGKPAVGVTVYCDTKAVVSDERAVTDEKGTAVITLFENQRYLIHVRAERNDKDFHATPIDIRIDKKVKSLKMVLAKEGFGYDDDEIIKYKSPN